MSHLEFARQSMDLMRILHTTVRLIHMDLRLDNFVVTEEGVGFVDFGSAARVGENFEVNPLLRSLFTEMLSSSQIQKDLARLRDRGRVTSKLFINSYQKVDQAVDLFYGVLQMNLPHANPDFRGLVKYEPRSRAARGLGLLTNEVLRPRDPGNPPFRTARDVLRGIEALAKTIDSPKSVPEEKRTFERPVEV